jgi:hypothetical protein
MADPSTSSGLPADIELVQEAYRTRDGSLHQDVAHATRQAVRLELQGMGLPPYAVEALMGPQGKAITAQLQRIFA